MSCENRSNYRLQPTRKSGAGSELLVGISAPLLRSAEPGVIRVGRRRIDERVLPKFR